MYDMAKVWHYYDDVCHVNGQDIPTGYLSRKQTLYDDVEKRIG